MSSAPERILFLFLDGVGIGAADARVNPFLNARLPTFDRLLGGAKLVSGVESTPLSGGARVAAADARLGVDGRPQSGTGQTALLTGVNAAARIGRHFGPWVPTQLRELLAEENVLRRARNAGRSVAFANAYPAGYLASDRGRRPRPAAPPLAAKSVGALDRDSIALRRGDAVASSIVNGPWREHLDPDVPEISAQEAGENLARITARADLTLFAHYDTDHAGHRGDMAAAISALERVDAFLEGLTAALPDRTLLLIGSDHGNLEDVSTGHTLNPVPIVVFGPGSDQIASRVRSIMDVTPEILAALAS